MGGGLNFLNKKTWHPARPQNLEEVWKREQKAAAEAKKVDELRKQLEEERKRSEFVQMAMDTGHLRKEERLDWMYGSGLQAKQDAEKRREDMLTGKAEVVVAPEQRAQETNRADQVAQLPSFTASAAPASQNETWLRLNNDPLFAIKRQQQEQLSKLKENPVKMMELLRNLTKAKEKEAKKKEKKERKEKKEKKSKKRERGSDGSDDSEGDGRAAKRSRSPPALQPRHGAGGQEHAAPAPPPPPRGHQERPPAGPRARSPAARRDYEAHDDGREYGGREYGAGGQQQRQGGASGSRDLADPRVSGHGGREQEYSRAGERERHDRAYDGRAEPQHERGGRDGGRRDGRPDVRGGQGGDGGGRHEDSTRDRDYERDRDRKRQRDADGERGRDGERGVERERDGERQRDHDRAQDGGQQQEQGRRRGEEERRDGTGGGEAGGGSSPGRHGREERRPDDRYGLKHSAVAPEVLLQADTRGRAAETRSRLEGARRNRQEEERLKAAQRYVRKEHKTGQMTEEERQRRLAEMMGNAEEHEAQRRRRLDAAAAADAVEEGQRLVNQADAARGGDAFLDAASKDVYSKLQGSLEARVNSRRHFSAR